MVWYGSNPWPGEALQQLTFISGTEAVGRRARDVVVEGVQVFRRRLVVLTVTPFDHVVDEPVLGRVSGGSGGVGLPSGFDRRVLRVRRVFRGGRRQGGGRHRCGNVHELRGRGRVVRAPRAHQWRLGWRGCVHRHRARRR